MNLLNLLNLLGQGGLQSWVQPSLPWTALVMGLVGGPHCVAMCGAACAGISQSVAPRQTWGLLLFQIGRVVGYSILGMVAASSLQGLGWLTVHSAALRPVWSLFHVAAVALGLMLLIQARQPVWLEDSARRIWQKVRARIGGQGGQRGMGAPFVIGIVWTLLPCGLLYSALMLAALAVSPVGGGLVMAAFVLGTSITMMLAPWAMLRWGFNGNGNWGMRLAGAGLAASSAWALWMALAHNEAPWCVT